MTDSDSDQSGTDKPHGGHHIQEVKRKATFFKRKDIESNKEREVMSLTGSRGVSLLKVSVVLSLVVCLSSKMGGVDGAVISIDFSSEWLKIALVKVLCVPV